MWQKQNNFPWRKHLSWKVNVDQVTKLFQLILAILLDCTLLIKKTKKTDIFTASWFVCAESFCITSFVVWFSNWQLILVWWYKTMWWLWAVPSLHFLWALKNRKFADDITILLFHKKESIKIISHHFPPLHQWFFTPACFC